MQNYFLVMSKIDYNRLNSFFTEQMEVILNKQSKKYVASLTDNDKKRVAKAVAKLFLEPPEGDIKKLQGKDNDYRVRDRGFKNPL